MTSRAAEITSAEITAEAHGQRLREVMRRLSGSSALRIVLVQPIRLRMRDGWPMRGEYREPELEVRDHRGTWRATITVRGDEFAVRLPGGGVRVQRPEQAALLAGAR